MATVATAIVAADANAISLLFMSDLISCSSNKGKCRKAFIGSAVQGVVYSVPKPKEPDKADDAPEYWTLVQQTPGSVSALPWAVLTADARLALDFHFGH